MGGLTLAQFAVMTAKVLAADGIDAYQPTIALIDIRQLVVIEGILTDVAQSDALLDAIDERGLRQTHFAFGVRTGENVTIGLCNKGACEFGVISEDASGAGVVPIPPPAWWPSGNEPSAS